MSVPNTPLLRWGLFVIVALLAAGVYVWWIMPLQERRSDLNAQLEQKRKEFQLLTARPNVAQQSAGRVRVELEKVREAVPEDPYRDRLVQDLRMLESVTRLQFSDYNFQPVSTGSGTPASQTSGQENGRPSAAPTVAQLQLKTSVKGEWTQIRRLLEEIQTMRRLVRVERVELQADAAPPVKLNADKRLYTCQLTLSAYYAPDLKTFFPDPMPIRVGPEP